MREIIINGCFKPGSFAFQETQEKQRGENGNHDSH